MRTNYCAPLLLELLTLFGYCALVETVEDVFIFQTLLNNSKRLLSTKCEHIIIEIQNGLLSTWLSKLTRALWTSINKA